jgi:predicted dehydrogenase
MKFGVLGDAKIAREKLLPAISAAGHEVTHLGRRDPSGGPDPVWGDVRVSSYEEMLADPDIDAVYNPLPNHLHVPMSIAALEAGKPVICEKPVALSVEELDRLAMVAARTGLYLYDGYMVRYHPQWDWLRRLDLGARTHVTATFTYPPQPEGNVRNVAAWGGGPVWDIGGYTLLAGMMLLDGRPRLIGATTLPEAHLDVERSASALVNFDDGQVLTMSVSSGATLCQSVLLTGTDGWARLDTPFNPAGETTARWAHARDGKEALLGTGTKVRFGPCDQYELMVQDFATAVAKGRPTDLSESRDLVRVLSEWLRG